MKKKILIVSIFVGSAILVGCTDPSSDNSSLLQNNLIKNTILGGKIQQVGIREAVIPGFENLGGENPTQVTVTYSGGAQAARTAGCIIASADGRSIDAPAMSAISPSYQVPSPTTVPFDSMLAVLDCNATDIDSGTYTADVNISFTAGGKNYTAKTTLTATV